MNIKNVAQSRVFKVLVVLACASAVKYRKLWAELGPLPWFHQELDPNVLKGFLRDESNKFRIDEVYRSEGDDKGNLYEGFTGLMYHVQLNNREQADEFIKAGASLDIQAKNDDKQGTETGSTQIYQGVGNERYFRDTALHLAILNFDDYDTLYKLNPNDFGIVQDLVKGLKKEDGTWSEKANVTIKNGKGFTPLHIAVSSIESPEKSWKVVEMLVDASGNKQAQEGYLNEQNSDGNTPLHIMATLNKVYLTSKIIEKYGRMLKLDIRNKPIHDAKEGQTPEELANDCGFGTSMGEKLKVDLQRYKDPKISEEDYKLHPKFEDIPSH